MEEDDNPPGADGAPGSPASSAPPAAQGVSIPAASLSENPVFKRARGEKVMVGARPANLNDGDEARPISGTELEMRFYALQDGAESVYDEDFGDTRKKKRKKSVVVVEGTEGPDGDGTKRRAAQTGLRSDQLDSLVNDAAFGGPSTAARSARAGEADGGVGVVDDDDGASESAASSGWAGAPGSNGLLRLNGITCVACALAASMNPVEDFLRENLGKLSDEAIYRNAHEVYERDIAGPARREGADTPRISWKALQVHYEQHSLDPIIQRHTQLRALQKMRTLLSLGACRDDGTGNSVLDLKKSDQVMKIIDKERGLRQELEELKRKKK